MEESYIQRYEKSFLSSERVDFAAIFSADYGEVRWDNNGDGKIDVWFVQKGPIQIQEEFQGDKIQRISIQKRIQNGHVFITYVSTATGSLKLVENDFIPFRVQHNAKAPEDDLSLGFSEMLNNAEKTKRASSEDICKTPIKSFFGSAPADWSELRSAVAVEDQRARLAKMISEECKGLLSTAEHEKLYKSILNVYELDLDGKVEDSKMLSCLVKYDETRNQLPAIATKLALAPFLNPQMKINCVPGEPRKCGLASFDEKHCRMDLSVSKPSCHKDMEVIFTSDIFHETLHSANHKMSEETVQAITKECLGSVQVDEKASSAKNEMQADGTKIKKTLKEDLANNKELQKLAADASQSAEVLSLKDAVAAGKIELQDAKRMPTAAIKDVNSKTAPSKVTNVPAEIAAGKVSPGTPLGDKSGYASLNSDFRPVNSSSESSKPTLNESYSRSITRTSPVLSMANSLVRGAVVAPAQAQTSSSSSETRSSRSIASSNDNSFKASNSSSRSTVSKVKPEWISKGSPTGVSASASNSSQENFVMPSGPQVNQIAQGSAGRNEQSSSEIAGSGKAQAIAAAPSSKAATRNPASSGNLNSPVKASGQSSMQSPGQAPANAQRDFYTKQLGLKRGTDLWTFVKKNNDNLKTQGIHILDTNNRIWGHTNPENAVIRFREQNNRLIREN